MGQHNFCRRCRLLFETSMFDTFPCIITNSYAWSFGIAKRSAGGRIAIVSSCHLDLTTSTDTSFQNLFKLLATFVTSVIDHTCIAML